MGYKFKDIEVSTAEKIRQLLDQGFSPKEIAKELNADLGYVYIVRLRYYGPTKRPRQRPRPGTKSEKICQMLIEGIPPREVAKRLGIDPSYVSQVRKRWLTEQ